MKCRIWNDRYENEIQQGGQVFLMRVKKDYWILQVWSPTLRTYASEHIIGNPRRVRHILGNIKKHGVKLNRMV